mmetsp:Transcript_16579/g.41009  ORF Transcript_16579/g.41009 Transcript_16579/m.41009 type:complete len:573 (-) Transcript_16579:167-1885(-)|eukprot:CAMPEP_0178991854 /NCGR_PEP_ID=MMETSP0795-20121207/5773_1 /TAXON_ID=88552 /ORGANISM="Amoebophrya sp., Strain Ameob2" /LENGTH=572 /DNA_ID=CAMNT_0020683637 /DNA_START=113 /DNA_END=1831 /DNA_ORIENTATION=-
MYIGPWQEFRLAQVIAQHAHASEQVQNGGNAAGKAGPSSDALEQFTRSFLPHTYTTLSADANSASAFTRYKDEFRVTDRPRRRRFSSGSFASQATSHQTTSDFCSVPSGGGKGGNGSRRPSDMGDMKKERRKRIENMKKLYGLSADATAVDVDLDAESADANSREKGNGLSKTFYGYNSNNRSSRSGGGGDPHPAHVVHEQFVDGGSGGTAEVEQKLERQEAVRRLAAAKASGGRSPLGTTAVAAVVDVDPRDGGGTGGTTKTDIRSNLCPEDVQFVYSNHRVLDETQSSFVSLAEINAAEAEGGAEGGGGQQGILRINEQQQKSTAGSNGDLFKKAAITTVEHAGGLTAYAQVWRSLVEAPTAPLPALAHFDPTPGQKELHKHYYAAVGGGGGKPPLSGSAGTLASQQGGHSLPSQPGRHSNKPPTVFELAEHARQQQIDDELARQVRVSEETLRHRQRTVVSPPRNRIPSPKTKSPPRRGSTRAASGIRVAGSPTTSTWPSSYLANADAESPRRPSFISPLSKETQEIIWNLSPKGKMDNLMRQSADSVDDLIAWSKNLNLDDLGDLDLE